MAEIRIEDEAVIAASPAQVWAAIKNPAAHAKWHPYVTRITGDHSLGAIRTCAVLVGKKSGETKERCVEDEEQRRIVWAIEEDSTGFSRMVSEWRAGFTLQLVDGATRVAAESTFRPDTMMLRLMRPLVIRKFHRAKQSILTALKRAVEADAGQRGVAALEEKGG